MSKKPPPPPPPSPRKVRGAPVRNPKPLPSRPSKPSKTT